MILGIIGAALAALWLALVIAGVSFIEKNAGKVQREVGEATDDMREAKRDTR